MNMVPVARIMAEKSPTFQAIDEVPSVGAELTSHITMYIDE
jgi:hypothetical protein